MIQIFDSMTELLESVPKENMTFEMCNAFVKAWGKIHGYGGGKSEVHPFTMYPKIMVSVSGGADSDIVLDLVERIGYPLSEVHYAFFDTGLEFAATKRHLEYLEQKYGITIERYRAKIPVPLGVKKYGVPFLSKKISNNIQRLQKHGFKWEDIFHGHELDKSHMIEELGDVAWYLAVLCDAIGSDLDTVMEENLKKLEQRYPEGFDPYRSQHRNELGG